MFDTDGDQRVDKKEFLVVGKQFALRKYSQYCRISLLRFDF